MNQSILFADIQTWDEQRQAVCFSAQQSGALIECLIRLSDLEKLTEMQIGSAEQALQLFCDNRFIIEELAEALIEEERFNLYDEIEVIS